MEFSALYSVPASLASLPTSGPPVRSDSPIMPSNADESRPEKSLPDDLGGAAGLLDIELVDTSPERVTATMPVTPRHHQPFGMLHGGVSVLLAETVASIGAYLAAPENHTAVGLEVNANHVRSVREGRVVAVGTPLHTGRTTHVWEVKLHHEGEKLICVSRCTLAIVEDTSGRPS